MNKTIILNDLSGSIAALTGCSVAEAENFIRELSALVAERLDSDGQVEVPGLGTFVVTDETVAFAPDRELAEDINAPFAAFEAVELPDAEVASVEETDSEEIAAAAEFEQESLAEEPLAESDADTVAESEEPPVEIPEYRPVEKIVDNPAEEPMPVAANTDNGSEDKKRPLTWPWWLIACIVCFIAGYILGDRPAAEAPDEVILPADSIEAVDIAPLPESVEIEDSVFHEQVVDDAVAHHKQLTDTITSLKFLTTIARKHYGHIDFWPYIYEANASRLGHPDRLVAGTVVVIPPADSLRLNPKDPEQLKVARDKASEIYSRFNAK